MGPKQRGTPQKYGCVEIVECWEDNVPDGKQTDFRRAVDAKAGEKIVFSWQVWPDKATLESTEARMREDERFAVSGEIPFDAKRLIYGCFTPIYMMSTSDRAGLRIGEIRTDAPTVGSAPI